MKRLLAILSVTDLLYGCGKTVYTITGRCDLEPGDSVFLFGKDRILLAAGMMGADTTFTQERRIATLDIASLSDRYGTVEPVKIFLEPGIIRVECQSGRG